MNAYQGNTSEVDTRRGWSQAQWDAWYAERRRTATAKSHEDDLSAGDDVDLVADVVTSLRPDLTRAVVVSKVLDLNPQWYRPDAVSGLESIQKRWEDEMPAGVAALVDQLVRAHPQLTRQQALLHVLNQDPELYELRWPQRP
jgi:hypothetical protein